MDEFLVEVDSSDDLVVVHAIEGHRYHFHATSYENGKVLVLQNDAADHSADLFEGAAGRFAIREALALGLIDSV